MCQEHVEEMPDGPLWGSSVKEAEVQRALSYARQDDATS